MILPPRRHSRFVPALAALLPLLALACAPPVPVPLTPSPPADEVAAPRDASGPWWAVRLESAEEPAAAHDRASEAALRFDEPVEVVSGGGAWHVHVGACASEEQAHALAALARARGYRSAAVVAVPRPDLPEAPKGP